MNNAFALVFARAQRAISVIGRLKSTCVGKLVYWPLGRSFYTGDWKSLA